MKLLGMGFSSLIFFLSKFVMGIQKDYWFLCADILSRHLAENITLQNLQIDNMAVWM